MRRIVTAALATVSSLVLLFAYPTSHNEAVSATGGGSATAAPSTDDGSDEPTDESSPVTTSGGDGDDADASSPASSPTSSSAGSPTSGSATRSPATRSSSTKTYTGDEVQTRWGVVQVRITVRNGKITAAEAVKHPDTNPRDVEINDYALPILGKAVVQAQSASIDSVSGATVTSHGYIESLQSALDAAHL